MNQQLARSARQPRDVASRPASVPAPAFELLLETVCDAHDLLVLVVDAGGRIVAAAGRWDAVDCWNEAAIEPSATGFDGLSERLSGGGPERDRIARAIQRIAAGELDQFTLDVQWRRRGEEAWFALRLLPLRATDGGVLAVAEDVTEHRQARAALDRMQRRYALATSAGGVGVWDLNVASGAMFLDPSLKAVLGYLDREVPDTLDAWSRFVHPDDRNAVEGRLREHLEGGSAIYEVEHRMRHRDGSVRWFLARGLLIERRNGQPYRVVGTEVDITDRKRIEAALVAEHRKYRRLFEEAGIALCELDLTAALPGLVSSPASSDDGGRAEERLAQIEHLQRAAVVRHANARAVELFGGWPGPSGPVVSLAGLDRGLWLGLRDALVARATRFEQETTAQLASGERRDIVLCATIPLRDAPRLVTISALDVTERNRARVALRASQAAVRRRRREIRQLGNQLLVAQDAERRRIGQELHDDVCQRLALLEILAANALDRRADATETLEEMRRRLAELSNDVRRLSHDMSAPALAGGQLERHLRTFVEEVSRLAQLRVRLEFHDLPGDIPADAGLCIYRVVQEAVRNVARHARTDAAAVRVDGAAGGVRIVIEDAGCGFHPPRAEPAGLGLVSMRERLQRLHGRFDVVSEVGRGTRIEAWLPLTQ